MEGIARVDLTGHLPVVECRTCEGQLRYFVCFPDLKKELVMGFEDKITAREIAVNVYHATPFFTAIPVVKYQTPYPRPWLVYPSTEGTWRRIDIRMVRGG